MNDRRGTRLQDGRRFDGIKNDNLNKLRPDLPSLVDTTDSLSGVLNNMENTVLKVKETLEKQYNQDGLLEKDRYRAQLIEAVLQKKLTLIPELLALSLLNTMRLNMLTNGAVMSIIFQQDRELADELVSPDCRLLLINDADFKPKSPFRKTLYNLIKKGKVSKRKSIRIESTVFSVMQAADLLSIPPKPTAVAESNELSDEKRV